MAASAKKKKEKKKDFQKAKLRVGKTKTKPDSFTNTTFKAKCTNDLGLFYTIEFANTVSAIVLHQQSLSASAPSISLQFSHHLSLLTSRSENQRRDALAYLTSAIASRPLDQPLAVVIEKVRPLLLDGSQPVRQQLNKLFRALPGDEVRSNAGGLILHIRAGMTHLSNDIRMTALDAFEWLVEKAGEEVVSAAGAWVKTLKCFLGLLGWQQYHESKHGISKWSTLKEVRARPVGGDKLFVRQLQTFTVFLEAGFGKQELRSSGRHVEMFPLWQTYEHILPSRSNPYAHLNLFGIPRDEENEAYQDLGDRQRIFQQIALSLVNDGLALSKREGGEVGRAAAALRRAVDQGMADFVEEEM